MTVRKAHIAITYLHADIYCFVSLCIQRKIRAIQTRHIPIKNEATSKIKNERQIQIIEARAKKIVII